jgi:hypothetical protein
MDRLFCGFKNIDYAVSVSRRPFALSSVTRIPRFTTEEPYPVSFRIRKPTNYKYDRKTDWDRYGSLLGVNSFMTEDEPARRFEEREVSHPRYVGDIEDLDTGDSRFSESTLRSANWYGAGIRPITLLPYGLGFTVQKTSVNSDGYLTYVETPANHGDLAGERYAAAYNYWSVKNDIMDFVRSGGTPQGSFLAPEGVVTQRWLDIEDSSSQDGDMDRFNIRYVYEMSYLNNYMGDYIAQFDVHLDINVGFVPEYGTNSASDELNISSGAFWVANNSSVSLKSWSHPAVGVNDPTVPSINIEKTQLCGMYTLPYQPAIGSVPHFVSYRMVSGYTSNGGYLNKRSDRYEELINHQLIELRPAAYLSSSKALQDYLEVIKTNSIQNLQHLADLVDILPNLQKLPELLAKATRGDPSVIIELIDYVTEAILKYRFQQKPTGDFVDEVAAHNYEREFRRLLSTRRATIYGDFSYTFLDSENFMGQGRLVLDARSKLRIAYDASTLLNGLLLANSVGLLPTLSRIWEILPFSFVIDWFTNMKGRIKQVDNQITWLAVHSLWSLHSYSLTYYPSDEELAAYGLKQLSVGRPFGFKLYLREFTRCTPHLSESRFDFLRPAHGPNPVTVGALIWQLLR